MFRYAQHDKIPSVIARHSRSNQPSMSARHGWLPRVLANARNDTWNLVMLSEAKHLFQIPSCFGFPLVFISPCDSILGFFLQGGQGDYLRSVPLSPFDPQPLHALLLGWEDKNQSGAVLWLRHSFARAFSCDREMNL